MVSHTEKKDKVGAAVYSDWKHPIATVLRKTGQRTGKIRQPAMMIPIKNPMRPPWDVRSTQRTLG